MTWTDLLLLFGLLGLGVLGFELVLGAHDDATASAKPRTRESRVVVAKFGKPRRDRQESRRGTSGDSSQSSYRVKEGS